MAAQEVKNTSAESSLLSSGEWFRLALTNDGIYRIDYSVLKQLGPSFTSNPRIFCNNQGQLPYYNNIPVYDDLKEISISISTGSDGIFNEGDYLLFYGQAPDRWIFNSTSNEYNLLRHNYSDTSYYFITSGPGSDKIIGEANEPLQTENYISTESDAVFFHEVDEANHIKSGREWLQPISVTRSIPVNHGFTDLLTSEKIKFNIKVAGRASVPTIFRLYEGSAAKKSLQVLSVNLFSTTGTQFQLADSAFMILPESASPQYEIRFSNNGESGALGWVDYVKMQARRANKFTGKSDQFSDYKSVAQGRVTLFSIQSQVNDIHIWDISDPLNPQKIKYKRTGEILTFKVLTDSLRKFIVFTTNNISTPIIGQTVIPNQDLHNSAAADMIIVTHPLFKSFAEELANIHYGNSGLISQVVTINQIYNEFSGGKPDICAIRNFLRMKYIKQKYTDHPLKYLLLFGDGSYENKRLPPNNPNFIPTYQSLNSNIIVSSFTSDDFYGLLDEDEGEAEGYVDIGIGRLPISDTLQARIMISKIRRYMNSANIGEWKNVICLVADDEDGNTHMSDAEGLSSLIQDSVPAFNIDKIYLDAFRQTVTVNGASYPDVNKAINDRINAGCLVFNYTGHGSESGFAHERVLRTDDIRSWRNKDRLPLFITATCEFSRFDDLEINSFTNEMRNKMSAGEMVLLSEEGGGIALMSTTRVVYSAPNYFLNKNIFNFAFDKDQNDNPMRLGDIIRLAKNNSGAGTNKRNFSLLGDPAIKLSYPFHGKVITDSINSIPISVSIDTLKALSLVTVSGHLEDTHGNLLNSFNGIVSPLVYDKASKIKTLANDGGQIMEFKMRNNILFSGKTMAKDGKFRFTFIVPRDIDYTFGSGKISYYASDQNEEMNGSFSDFIVGGFASTTINDNEGPQIKIFMNDTLFRNGGITDSDPKLLVILEDEGGINISGSGIGHDLLGTIDGNPANSFMLNNYFINDFDNYRKGKISYNLTGLDEGGHTVTVKAWDNFNNSSEAILQFVVENNGKFILKNLLNYPNPFFNETKIIAEHNRPDSELDIIINIYSLNGRLIKVIQASYPATGYTIPPIEWDGNDDGGHRVGRGIYPYSIIVRTSHGELAKASGRMIIL